MASTPESRDLTGLARSLDRLFQRTERVVADPGAGITTAAASGLPKGLAALARKLGRRVEEYLSSTGSERGVGVAGIRSAAAELLGAGDVEPVADAVVRLAGVPPGDPRATGAHELARELTSPAIARRLVDRLGAVRDEERREGLTVAVGRLGRRAAEALGDALTRTENRAARHTFTNALAKVGEDAADVLATMSRDERWFVVRNAVLVLGGTEGAWAVRPLTSCLWHPDWRVRRETLIALARIGGPAAGRPVPGMLSDPDPRVREAAALASGELEEASAVGDLLEVLRRGDEPAVEVAVLRALGRIGDPRALGEMEKKAEGSLLSRPPREVRLAAYRALAAVGTARAMVALRKGLADRDADARAVAEELLKE